MSDTAGIPPEGQGGAGRPLGPGSGSSPSGRGAVRRRRRRWVWGVSLGVSLALAGAAAAGWAVYMKLEGNITPDEAAAAELARFEKDRPTALVKDALNILLIGSDSRAGAENRRYGRDPGTERSDTVILLHLSAGRRSATAVSIPRDLMVDVPDCRRPDGSRSAPMFTQFNAAFEVGGSACTIRTVEKLTDIRVDHHVVVDFEGFKDMVDAVDGVEVCLSRPIDDKDAHLHLPAGRVTLDGEQALGYVRARKSLGDGSDTGRIERQQRFLGALVNKVRSNEILLNPVKLYPVLDAATSSLTTDPELASLRGLYELVRGLRDIPTEGVQFLTVPRESYAGDVNRDQLAQPAAGKLFERLRKDEALRVSTDGERKATEKETAAPADSASPEPTFSGNTAAEDTCA
ncbi:LCP family protein [Streptomyces althioticus]|uniref:LytR family transcriptional regulator n=1 Tax=Streptomyces griseorubens TaxID=66897 RepID=A0ABR4T303_9ACTN|nr:MULTISPECIES: LCP family protein [Actinomycetes]ALV51481.1 LytR family transcriptional regulator [Streptomyces sp. 4F]MCC9686394.1 LCP family protein [Streptomyces sp. MNU103]WTC24845.1 LCP family protein [Streptomyces althioticus]GGT66556.1 transcriptional regulator [Streptomyces matensis]KEG41834.1 LytR family transcriptional regulator [Streptomyces griseorubens]